MKSNYVAPTITLCCMRDDVIRTSGEPLQPVSTETVSGFEKVWIS